MQVRWCRPWAFSAERLHWNRLGRLSVQLCLFPSRLL